MNLVEVTEFSFSSSCEHSKGQNMINWQKAAEQSDLVFTLSCNEGVK
jgi:hypothetical protein